MAAELRRTSRGRETAKKGKLVSCIALLRYYIKINFPFFSVCYWETKGGKMQIPQDLEGKKNDDKAGG